MSEPQRYVIKRMDYRNIPRLRSAEAFQELDEHEKRVVTVMINRVSRKIDKMIMRLAQRENERTSRT